MKYLFATNYISERVKIGGGERETTNMRMTY